VPIPSLRLPLGTRMPWFSVTDLQGTKWTTASADGRPASVIAFLSRHSPYVKHIERSLAHTTNELQEQGVLVLGVAANDSRAYPSDGPQMLELQRSEAGFRFPYALDETQQMAKAFEANCTPEFYVYDRDRRLVYHGQYDASRPDNEIATSGIDILQAIDAVRSGEIVDGDQSVSLGCSVKWRAGNEPSYALAS
jgi:peroxiredoxin